MVNHRKGIHSDGANLNLKKIISTRSHKRVNHIIAQGRGEETTFKLMPHHVVQCYKIFTNAFKVHLRPTLMDASSQDQSIFLPFKFVLNNILLTHEIISWAKRSKQPLVFFKLDLSKAYDRMNWSFFFGCMKNLGTPIEFINMTKLIFKEVSASIVVNGKAFEAFAIEKGMQ